MPHSFYCAILVAQLFSESMPEKGTKMLDSISLLNPFLRHELGLVGLRAQIK